MLLMSGVQGPDVGALLHAAPGHACWKTAGPRGQGGVPGNTGVRSFTAFGYDSCYIQQRCREVPLTPGNA